MEAIERSLALLSRPGERLARQDAGADRARLRQRHQATGDPETAAGERGPAARRQNPAKPIARAKALRQQAAAAIAAFAGTEDAIARVHERLAAAAPDGGGEYRRVAQQARGTAAKARAFLREFTG